MNNKTKTITLPSMLSFERKLETSDGLMFAGNWEDNKENMDDWKPIRIVPRQNRSTQSAFGIDDSKKIMPNPVSSDSDDSNLPMNKDTLRLSFTMRVIGNIGQPFACNAPDFANAIKNKVNEFKNSEGINELARCYAYNIANGRFLWRNRVGVETIEIHVSHNEGVDVLKFNAYDYSLNDFDQNNTDHNLKSLTEVVKKGLSGDENKFILIKVDAFVKLGFGQHVFPSQEMNMVEKKKKLFQLNGCAAMHNVKIGNAIRTIDIWYGDDMLIKAEGKGKKTKIVKIDSPVKYPIAIEPYGSVTQHGRAYRANKNDLYKLMLNWVNDMDIVKENDKKFVVANLIRGGVFGGDSEG